MTKLYSIVQRCPSCGYKKIYYVDYFELNDFNKRHPIFNQSKCYVCQPQTTLDIWGLQKGIIGEPD